MDGYEAKMHPLVLKPCNACNILRLYFALTVQYVCWLVVKTEQHRGSLGSTIASYLLE